MDNPGFRAGWRAKRENEGFLNPQRGPDGKFLPVEGLTPMDESFIGGFFPQASIRAGSPMPPELPPKDDIYKHSAFPSSQTSSTITTGQLTTMTAVERSKILRIARMDPHLQFMVGPLLKYDTVDADGVWHGAALVVTSDSSSTYEPHPMLTYSWDPEQPSRSQVRDKRAPSTSFDLGPHPADPHSITIPIAPSNGRVNGPSSMAAEVNGQEIYVYGVDGGTFTFWRFMIRVPLAQQEMSVTYSINKGQQLRFFVPGLKQNMRWAVTSCNGFSAGVNPDDFRGPGFQSGYDPVWTDLLIKHAQSPFHVLVGGGDQLYCDSLTREPELQEWVAKMKAEDKKSYVPTDEIITAVDRFYFNHYCQSFRSGAFARANCSIPMMNMCDDHDLIDGFGSYPDDLQRAPMFKLIGSRGYFYFLLFQCFINPDVDGLDASKHPFKSLIIGSPGPYVPYPSHSFIGYLGPKVAILLLDCRAERKKEQVCSAEQYATVFARMNVLPGSVEHLVVQIGIPIAYPRMVFLESALESKFNPLVALGKSGSLGLSGFVNKFNAEAELLDDLNDHWTARSHKAERNWFIEQLQQYAKTRRVRISFVSGDVHCAAVGYFKSLRIKGKPEILPVNDHRYMVNVTTSAIVNTPPPNAVINLVSSLGTKVHKTLHHISTDESMMPIFEKEPDGSSRKQKIVMGRRNYCTAIWEEATGDLVFDVRVEKEKGHGETVGYIARTPAPNWSRS